MERHAPKHLNPILDRGSPSSFADLRRQKLLLRLQGLNFTLSQLSLLAIKLLGPKEALDVKDLGFIGSWRQEQTIELTRARLI
jgi:hypothetical protein